MVPQAQCSAARQCWLRAWDRAKAEKLVPFYVAPGVYSVKTYTVRVTGAGWSDLTCDCAAGRSGKICKHQAVSAKARAIGVRPIRPSLPQAAPIQIADSSPEDVALSERIKQEVRYELVAGVAPSLQALVA